MVAEAIGSAAPANAMFARPLVRWSAQERFAGHLWLAEAVATAGLIVLIFGLARTGRAHLAPLAMARMSNRPFRSLRYADGAD